MPPVKKPAAPKRATAASLAEVVAVPTEEVALPDATTVIVRGLTGEQQINIAEADGNFQINLLIACIVEPELDYDAATALYQGSYKVFNLIVSAINRCNGEGASEEALKTFPAGAPE